MTLKWIHLAGQHCIADLHQRQQPIMDTGNRPLQKSKGRRDQTLPPAGERVVVRCEKFTCLAYRDSKGVWRAAKDDSELPQVLEVVFRF